MQRYLAVVVVFFGCVKSESLQCDADLLCPLDQLCDLTHRACIDPDQLTACEGLVQEAPCEATAVPVGNCDQGVCLPARCGDGVKQPLEECDGTASPLTCTDLGYYDSEGTPVCTDDCIYEPVKARSGCAGYCGDGEVQVGIELCDGNDPPIACVDLGFGAGALACNTQTCNPRLDDCKRFGWAITPMGARIGDIHGTSTNNIFAVGAPPAAYAAHYNGLEWSEIPLTGCSVPSTPSFSSLWTVGPDEAYAASGGAVIRLTPAGCMRLPDAPAAINDIYAASATSIYVTSAQGIHEYNGTSWTQVSTLARDVIWASGPSDIWAAGTTGVNNVIHYDGSSWSSPATLVGTTTITALFGTSPSEVYAAGATSMFEFDGASWSAAIATNTANPPYSGTVAFGRPFLGYFDGTVQSFDGSLWTVVQESGVYAAIFALWTEPETGDVLAGVNGAPLLLRYSGARRIDTDPLGAGEEVAIKSATEVYIIAEGGSDSGFLRRWDGTQWQSESNAGLNVSGVWIDAVGTVRVVESVGNGTTGGMRVRTGTNAYSLMPNSVSGVRMWGAAATDFWVMQGEESLPDQQVLRHYVNGAPQTCATCSMVPSVRDVKGTSTSNVFFASTLGRIYRWNGSAIVLTSTGTTNGILSLGVSPDGQHIWAAGADATLLHWDDTGGKWDAFTAPPLADDILSVWGTSPTDVFVGTAGVMYHFDGTRWSPVDARSGGIRDIESFGDAIYYTDANGSSSPLHAIVRSRPW